MTKLRRLCGLAIIVTLSQLMLTGVQQHCTSHNTPASGSHTGMPMPADQAPPCDDQAAPEACAAMVSCASTMAETVSVSVAVIVPTSARIVGLSATPTFATSSPDTPPPRV